MTMKLDLYFCEMEDEDSVIAACTALIFITFGTAELTVIRRDQKWKHSTWVRKYICVTPRYGAYHTLLPELAANDVNCVTKWTRT